MKLLADKFRDPIIRILLLAAVLSLAIGFVHKDFTESIGIICAIILATCVGFWFEWDAMRRFRRLNQVNDDIPVKVMRDGAMHEVPRRDVVVGDVVYIESGETVPVDGELVEAVSLRINESTLTGELEVDKTVDEAALRPRCHLSVERRAARHYGRRRLRRDGLDGRGRCDRSRARYRTGDRPKRRADAAQPPADTPFETDRPCGHRAFHRYFLRHARQGDLHQRLARRRLARHLAARAAHLHGFGGDHRDGRSRRVAHEHHAVAGHVHAADAQDQ